MTTEHIVRSFDEELKGLFRTIQDMGGLAQSLLEDAVAALMKGDRAAAEAVIARDSEIDKLHFAVNSSVQHILARRQPVALDLREIVSCGRIAADIERVGDHAKNIAKRAVDIGAAPPPGVVPGLHALAEAVRRAFGDVMEAFVARDPKAALTIWQQDKASDEIFDQLFEQLLGVMQVDPSRLRTCTHLMFIAKGLERVGDHATNIAEDIVYWVIGSLVTAERDKG